MLDENPSGDSPTLADVAARRLRGEILAGSLAPAERLRLRALSQRFGIGATPLREALARLTAEGFVVAEGQRGFSVPPITRAHLADITASRQIAEAEALRLAMRHGDAGWEDGIVSALALLRAEVKRRRADSAWLDAYEVKHHAFHRALIAACPWPSLRGFCDELYMQKTRYRRVLKGATRNWAAMLREHEELARLVLARAPQPATAALQRHIGATADAVLRMLAKG